MKQKRKIFAILVAFAMLIGGIPVGAFDVHAANEEHNCWEWDFDSEDNQYVLKKFTDDIKQLEKNTYYYLTEDVTLKHDVKDADDSSAGQVPIICLNGYDIYMGDYRITTFLGDQITPFNSGVAIRDCQEDNRGKITGNVDRLVDLGDTYYLPPTEYAMLDDGFVLENSHDGIIYEKSSISKNKNIWRYHFNDVEIWTPDDYELQNTEGAYHDRIGSGHLNMELNKKSQISEMIRYSIDATGEEAIVKPYIISGNLKMDSDIMVDADDASTEAAIKAKYNVKLYLEGEELQNNGTSEWIPYDNGSFSFTQGSFNEPLYIYEGGEARNYTVDVTPVDTGNYAAKFSYLGDAGDGYPRYYYVLSDSFERIDTININMTEAAGRFPSFTLDDSVENYEIENTTWENSDGDVIDNNATPKGLTTYRATIIIKPADNAIFLNDTEVKINSNAPMAAYKNTDETFSVVYEYTTEKDPTEYTGYTELEAADIDFDATQSEIKALLPDTVEIKTTEGNMDASVNWTTIPTINTSDLDGQTITASGTITLPDGVTNPNNVPTSITRTFIVAAAPQVAAPIADVTSGTYTEDKTVTLSAASGATIYYTLDGTEPTAQNGTQYNGSIEIKGKEGSEVIKTLKAIAVKNGMRDSDVATYKYKIDIHNVAPDISITVKESTWKNFLNNITFGLFFKNTVTVKIEATDKASEVAKIEYFVSDTVYTEEQLKNDSTIEWETYSDSFNVEPNSKNVVYARVTDTAAAANVGYARSGGFVLYTNSEAVTENLTYIKSVTDSDLVAEVKLNDNTIKEVKMEDDTLDSSECTVSNNGQITFQKTYLETLDAKSYTVTVSYNPLGESYVDANGNDAPADTRLTLKIVGIGENEDGTYTDGEGNTYIPVDDDNDGEPDDYIEVTPNGDGTYKDDEGDDYIPDQDGDGKPETDPDGDGVYDGSKDEDEDGKPDAGTYIPDQDGDGKPETDPDGDGVYDGSKENDDTTYIPDQDGDGTPEPDSDGDGIYEGTADDKTYIPDQDGDDKPEVDSDGDGVFEGTKDGDTYIGVDEDLDGDIDKIVEADKNESDGTYEDEDGNIYIPADTDKDGKEDEFIKVEPNEDGSYTDEDGNTYIPVDKDGDGKVDEFIEVTPNEDGSYTDEDGNIYIPIDADGDGVADEFIEVTANGDGTYSDKDGNIYGANADGIFAIVEPTETDPTDNDSNSDTDSDEDPASDTGDSASPLLWFMIMITAAGAAVVTRKIKA